MSTKNRYLLDAAVPFFIVALLFGCTAAIQSQDVDSKTPAGIAKRIIPVGDRATDKIRHRRKRVWRAADKKNRFGVADVYT